MIIASNDFKTAMKQPVKELQAYLEGEGHSIRDDNDLVSFKVSGEGGLCKSVMRKLEAKYLGDHNLLGKWVSAGYGVKLPSGAYEFLSYGSFLISELTVSKDTDETSVVAYDKMINAMRAYVALDVTYPIGLYAYTQKLCEACGLELGNSSFEVNNDLQVERELWENISGITYRDIFVQIAQATASTCIIGNDDKVYFKRITATGEQLTYDNMFKLKLENQYGEINSVVLSRVPQEDNVFRQDEASIEANGLTEFRIENNQLLDGVRDTAIEPLYNALKGVSYYPFEATTEGLGWYEIGDAIDIVTDTGDVFNTALFNFSISVSGSLKETLKTVADTKTQTQYQYATSLAKRVKNTEIITNKQDQEIKLLVSDVYDEDGVVNQKFTQIYQDINEIVNSVQNSGGNNLIKDSVMFAYKDTRKAEDADRVWYEDADGELVIDSNAESLANGCLSGHAFTLRGKKAWQTVSVKPSTEAEKTYYTFSTKIKKGAVGSCYVRLYNDAEEHVVEIPAGEEAFYLEKEIKGLLPKTNYYIVEFYGSADSDATFTDNMLAVGEYKSQWTQANGEVMNTQVIINQTGVLVKSSVHKGDYTVVSPLEFAGYANVNGTITKVFYLNKDVTKVKKLEAEDEVTMAPIKIVPVTTGDLQGWAFVPST